MFTFKRKKPLHPSTILIEGLAALTSEQLTCDDVWQPNQTTINFNDILSKAIVSPDDPVDKALLDYLTTQTAPTPQYQPFRAIPYDRNVAISGNIWHHGEHYVPAVKGAPEHILAHCDMSDNERESIMIRLHALSATGNMIIAIAAGLLPHAIEQLEQLDRNEKLSFIGFVSLKPVISAKAKQLLNKTNATIYVTTGQHSDTTHAILKAVGLKFAPQAIFDARRLEVMNADEINAAVASNQVFARATPDLKARIFQVLQEGSASTTKASTLAELQKLLAN